MINLWKKIFKKVFFPCQEIYTKSDLEIVDEKSLIERQPNKHPRELLKDFRLDLIAKAITERENT